MFSQVRKNHRWLLHLLADIVQQEMERQVQEAESEIQGDEIDIEIPAEDPQPSDAAINLSEDVLPDFETLQEEQEFDEPIGNCLLLSQS